PCHEANTASCFRIGNDLHCAPTGDICDALRSAAGNHGAKVSPCRVYHDPNGPPSAEPPPPPKPKPPQPPCTASKSKRIIGICKAEHSECDAARSSMLQRAPDLSPCHDVDVAVCFRVDDQPHCAPTNEICEALREAARTSERGHLGSCLKTSR